MWDNTTIQTPLIGIEEPLYMTVFSALFGHVTGLPLGILLVISAGDGTHPNAPLYKVLGVTVNITHSTPSLILMVMVILLTRLIVGISLGSITTIVPLTLSAVPFIARMVKSSLIEVDRDMIEATHSAGASDQQVVFKMLLPEAVPPLINGATIAITTILGCSATAGFIGGGGFDAIAANHGYYRYQADTMLVTVTFLVITVQTFQEIGTRSVGKSGKRKP